MSAQIDVSLIDPTTSLPFRADEPVIQSSAKVTEGPDPRFGDLPEWDLRCLGWPPNTGPNMNKIRFQALPAEWHTSAKCVAMAMLNPTHVALRDAGIFRTAQPYKPKTVRMITDAIGELARWAQNEGRPADLSAWGQEDCDTYLRWVQSNRAVSTARLAVDAIQTLRRYAPLMPDARLQFEPWNGASGAALLDLGGSAGSAIKTPAIPPTVWWPLIRACWRYIDEFSPDVLAARDQIQRLHSVIPTTRADRIDPHTVASLMHRWSSTPGAYVPLHLDTYGAAVKGEINWSALSRLITQGRSDGLFAGNKGHPGKRKHQVLEAIERGMPARFGCTDFEPAHVQRSDGSVGPWREGFDSRTVGLELTTLRNACYVFCAAMTMMRDSELMSLAAGCVTTFYGAPAVKSGRHKHQPHGTQGYWWITEPVQRAIELAERITHSPDRLFGSRYVSEVREAIGFDQHDELKNFVARINERSFETGLEPIPPSHLAPHMFRRTMAIITGQQPDGEIALGITLKHTATRALANATTRGYAAETAEWAREFKHEMQDQAASRLVYHWTQHSEGRKELRGAGATTFIDGMDKVSTKLTTASIGSPRLLHDLLRDEFSEIRLGTLNHCLGDPDKAACLQGKSPAVREAGMLPSLCSPATCGNSIVTESHLPIWLAEEADLTAKLKDRRLASIHRERIEAQLQDVRNVTQQEPR